MEMTKIEKWVVVILSGFLLLGSIMLHNRHSRALANITLEENSIMRQVSLGEMEGSKAFNKININLAGVEEIKSVHGIGETIAKEIIKHREVHGGFYCEKDLLLVKGIGNKKYEKIKKYLEWEK